MARAMKRSPSIEDAVSLPWRIAFGIGAPSDHLGIPKSDSKSNSDLVSARKPSNPLPEQTDNLTDPTSWSVPSTPSKVPRKCQVLLCDLANKSPVFVK